jgi:hypothetical protein
MESDCEFSVATKRALAAAQMPIIIMLEMAADDRKRTLA